MLISACCMDAICFVSCFLVSGLYFNCVMAVYF